MKQLWQYVSEMLLYLILFNINICSCEHINNNKSAVVYSQMPRILHVNIADQTCGGAAEIIFSLCKKLIDARCFVKVVASSGSPFHRELIKRGIPSIAVDVHWPSRALNQNTILAEALEKICKEEKIDIINVHKAWDYDAVKQVAKKFDIPTVAFYHSYEIPDIQQMCGFDAIFSVSPNIVEYLRKSTKSLHNVEFISPPFNEERLKNFVPSREKQAFFKEAFAINIKQYPIICMIANLFPCKNHEILLQAAAILIKQWMIPVQIMLAGADNNKRQKKLEDLVRKLGLEDYIFFLGYTSEIPELLFHSDITILPSKAESFGIVVLEAAMMKKPIVVSQNCGVAHCFIQDGLNGLVFDPENAYDLALALKKIVDTHPFAQQLGLAAYDGVTKHFSSDSSIEKILKIYKTISRT